MYKKLWQKSVLVGVCFAPAVVQAQFASSVVAYNAGTGISLPYQNSSTALGAPTTFIGYQNADPFNAPYQTNDIVGLGVNGSLTLQFSSPILNDAAHPYGLDFIVFGHAGFVENFDDGTALDGSLYAGGMGSVRVSVSADGVTFYTLNPLLSPIVDGLFPTDASGNPFLPVNPALTAGAFAGKDLAGIASLYDGSAGGAGFNLDWAVDGSNQSVSLASVQYVRLENLSGLAYIDAVSAVPEPSILALAIISSMGLVVWKRRTNV